MGQQNISLFTLSRNWPKCASVYHWGEHIMVSDWHKMTLTIHTCVHLSCCHRHRHRHKNDTTNKRNPCVVLHDANPQLINPTSLSSSVVYSQSMSAVIQIRTPRVSGIPLLSGRRTPVVIWVTPSSGLVAVFGQLVKHTSPLTVCDFNHWSVCQHTPVCVYSPPTGLTCPQDSNWFISGC